MKRCLPWAIIVMMLLNQLAEAQKVGVGVLSPQARFHLQIPTGWNYDIFRVDSTNSSTPFFLITRYGNIGIGTTTPSTSSILDIVSSNKGILIPRLTTSQRNAIPSPAHSLIIFNIGNFCLEVYDSVSNQWLPISCPATCTPCDTCPLPTIDSIKILSGLCVGDTLILSVYYRGGSIPIWAFPANWYILTLGDTVTVLTDTSHIGLIRVGVCNSCGCRHDSLVVYLLQGTLTPPVTITGDTLVCYGDTLRLKAFHNIATSWQWTVPPSWQIIAQNADSIVLLPDTTDGYVTVQVCNDSCLCSIDSVHITVRECATFCEAIGGPGDDVGYAGVRLGNSFFIVGTTTSYGQGSKDLYILRLSERGQLIDTLVIGGTNEDWAHSIRLVDRGNKIMIAGHTHSFGAAIRDVYLLKLDTSFNIQWTYRIKGPHYERLWDIKPTPWGDYIGVGSCSSFSAGGDDFYVVRVDSSGNLKWTLTVGGTNNDRGRAVAIDEMGNIYAVGNTATFGAGGRDVYLVKVDSAGNLIWARTIGSSNIEGGSDIVYLGDGKLVAVGNRYNPLGGDYDFYIVMLDTAGAVLWSRTVGSPGNDYAFAMDTIGDDIIVAGSTLGGVGGKDMYVVVLDTTGQLKWTRTVGGSGDEEAYDVLVWNKGILLIGYTTSFGQGGQDVYIVRLNRDGDFDKCLTGCQLGRGGTVQAVASSVSNGGRTRRGGTVDPGGGIVTTGGVLTQICP